jgi:hypothetical protein
LFDRPAHERLKAGTDRFKVRKEREPHARFPEFLQMISDTGRGRQDRVIEPQRIRVIRETRIQATPLWIMIWEI